MDSVVSTSRSDERRWRLGPKNGKGLRLCVNPMQQEYAVSRKLCGLMGFSGIVYAIIVTRRMRAQTAYRPQFEDWLFHVLLPVAAYLGLAISAFAARFQPREALFGVGGVALVLLLAGIHNAWDAVTYHVFVNARDGKRKH